MWRRLTDVECSIGIDADARLQHVDDHEANQQASGVITTSQSSVRPMRLRSLMFPIVAMPATTVEKSPSDDHPDQLDEVSRRAVHPCFR
jgi:hypothetical protein